MLLSLYHSFTAYEVLTPPRWVGFRNYERMLSDPLFSISLINTAVYTGMSVSVQLVCALAAALLLNVGVRGIGAFRLATYLPSQLPYVASSVIFLWIFEPNFGLANFALQQVGIAQQKWFFDPLLAKPMLALISAWGIGNMVLIFLAGLQSIPEVLYEAARVDGAGWWHQFTQVTVPMLSPIILFNLVISIIASFQVFDYAYMLTRGGPENATLFYVLYVFRNGFEYFNMGYAAALSWVLFVIVLVLTYVNLRLSGRWVHYEVSGR